MENLHASQPAGYFRRLAAMFYDILLLLVILIFGTYILLPLNHGAAIPAGNIDYRLYLSALISSFYLGFWHWRGQTLGMLAWGIRLVDAESRHPSFRRIVLRFVMSIITLSCFGIGLLWMLFDPQRRTLYDILSQTKLIRFRQGKEWGLIL